MDSNSFLFSGDKLQKAFENGDLQKFRERRLGTTPDTPDPQAILSRCIRCHAEKTYSGIPHIPFDRPYDLALSLQNKSMSSRKLIDEIEFRTSEVSPRRKQMPPGRRLNPAEHKALMDYLKSLAR